MLTIKTLKDLHELDRKYKYDKDSQETIRAYKYVTKDGWSPMSWLGCIQYIVGQEYQVSEVDTDTRNDCGAGINLATLKWCQVMSRNTGGTTKIFIMEFQVKDIAAIPMSINNYNDGKFRVRHCKVIRECDKIWRWLTTDIKILNLIGV